MSSRHHARCWLRVQLPPACNQCYIPAFSICNPTYTFIRNNVLLSIATFSFNNTWWRHQMETFSALLAICAGNSPVPGEFPAQRPVTRSFDVFFDLRLNKRLSKQSWGWWFETLPRPLWRHSNENKQNDNSQSTPSSYRFRWGTDFNAASNGFLVSFCAQPSDKYLCSFSGKGHSYFRPNTGSGAWKRRGNQSYPTEHLT